MKKITSLLFSLFLGVAGITRAQTEAPVATDPKVSIFDRIFAAETNVLDMEFATDLRQLIKGKYEEEYQPATLRWTGAQGQAQEWQVEIRARGNARKQICYFPPFKVKFDKDDLRAAEIDPEFNDLKVVWLCKSGTLYENYLLKEYLVYRMYNLISPNSLRVKLIRMRVVDESEKDQDEDVRWAFMIEPAEELADRMGGRLMESNPKTLDHVDETAYLRFAIFQYMIGNTDWAWGNGHNMEYIALPPPEEMQPIAYDFDYSGVVNTTYAVPHSSLPIDNVRQRYYRGKPCTADQLEAIRLEFMEKMPEILALCDSFSELDAKQRKGMRSYLVQFEKEIKDSRRFSRRIEVIRE